MNQTYKTWTPYPNLKCLYGKEVLIAINIPSSFISALINGMVFFLLAYKVSFTERSIICLTIADFLTATVSQPLLITVYIFQVLNDPSYYETSLNIQRVTFYLNCVTCSATVFSILFVIISRYIQIRFPFTHEEIITRKRLILVCIFIWLVSITSSLMAWFKGISLVAFYCLILFGILTEFLIIIFVCISILKITTKVVRDINKTKSPTKATKTVAIIVCMFTLSLVPFGLIGLTYFLKWPSVVWTYVSDQDCTAFETRVYATLYFYSIFLFHLHSTLNPFVYSFRDARIKRALFRFIGRPSSNTVDKTSDYQGT